MKTPAISIVTKCYNSATTIRKCANSILNQTLHDIQWIVLDNGSEDGCGKILEKYAKEDDRIKLVRNEYNYLIYPQKIHRFASDMDLFEICDGEYIATLDSDDIYDQTFAEKMYRLAKQHDADMVICGTTMVQEENPRQGSNRIPPLFTDHNLTTIGDNLPEFYGSFRAMWGKIFRRSLFQEHNEFLCSKPSYLFNGGDTFFCLRFLQVAKRIVCLDKSLHQYMIRKQSVYHSHLYPERWRCYDLLYQECVDILTRWNKLTLKNLSFLHMVHYCSIIDCIDVVNRSGNASKEERIAFLKNMLSSSILKLYLASMRKSEKDALFKKASDSVNNIYSNNPGQIFLWYCWLHETMPSLIGARTQINQFIASSMLFQPLTINQAVLFKNVIAATLQGDYTLAIEALFDLKENLRTLGKNIENYILLGQNVCAAAEYADGWLFFKKLQVSFLLDQNRSHEAIIMLKELEDLLPDDIEVKALRDELNVMEKNNG